MVASQGQEIEHSHRPEACTVTLLRGRRIFITDDPIDGLLLDQAITQLLLDRRAHGKREHPVRFLELQRECQLLAATSPATGSRHNETPAETPVRESVDLSRTMDVVEAAAELAKSEQMIRRDCDAGRLAAAKRAGKWRISRESVRRAKERKSVA
jgi:hypothetical protein